MKREYNLQHLGVETASHLLFTKNVQLRTLV